MIPTKTIKYFVNFPETFAIGGDEEWIGGSAYKSKKRCRESEIYPSLHSLFYEFLARGKNCMQSSHHDES